MNALGDVLMSRHNRKFRAKLEKLSREITLKAKAQLMADVEVEAGEVKWYWLSFCNNNGFIGVCIVQGFGPTDAVRQSHLRKINPGGEVMILEIGRDRGGVIKDEMKNRLLSTAEMERLGMKPRKMTDDEYENGVQVSREVR
jgi:hypothetical protein